jgi:arginyl-tRNA synthetase
MNIRDELEKRISAALTAAAAAVQPVPAIVSPAAKPEFGDYQANGVMAAAKAARMNPRALAAKVLEKLDLSDLAEKVEIAGPGFLNITLRTDLLARAATAAAADSRLGIAPAARPQRIVVDYSAPNLAKEMHVGHLRSTIIGDALVGVLEFLGHHIIRQNHVGDWGTQFGMLLAHLDELGEDAAGSELSDLEEFYRQAKKRFDEDPDFADKSRQFVVRLQSGDADCRRHWQKFIAVSLGHCQEVYARLNVRLMSADVRGESAYNADLPAVVEDLRRAGLLTESQGAQCVFLDEFKGEDDKPLPVIVQKSDGGYLYATTDLAAMRYRAGTLHVDRILYVMDHRQSLHLRQLFAVSLKAGFISPAVSLEHVAFGTMQGEDGRPFRTRAGGTVKLIELLDEAARRALEVVRAKSPEMPAEQADTIARVVGVGAVKYADLAMDRIGDYRFSFDKMLSLQGNTAPYMQYAYARIQSIFRKGAEEAAGLAGVPIMLNQPAERELAKRLGRLEEVLGSVAAECKPNVLTAYLYDLAGVFTTFYESCPVLKADSPEIRASRLRLCDLTARTIRLGLGLLGIEVVEQM